MKNLTINFLLYGLLALVIAFFATIGACLGLKLMNRKREEEEIVDGTDAAKEATGLFASFRGMLEKIGRNDAESDEQDTAGQHTNAAASAVKGNGKRQPATAAAGGSSD